MPVPVSDPAFIYRWSFALARYLPDGAPDPGFGLAGRVIADFGPECGGVEASAAEAHAVAIQPDGKIVAARWAICPEEKLPWRTRFALARFLPDGSLDPAFGGEGG